MDSGVVASQGVVNIKSNEILTYFFTLMRKLVSIKVKSSLCKKWGHVVVY